MKRMTPELVELTRRVGAWRKRKGGRGSRIPSELWTDAVRISRTVGVWATANALHFNYQDLQKRAKEAVDDAASDAANGVTAMQAAVATNGTVSPSFIALEVGPIGGPGQTVIDVVGRHGERMRVEVAGTVDVPSVVQAFWSRQP